MVSITETWTGTNGAAWPAQWTLGVVGTAAVADIQTNAGRLRTVGGTAYDAAYRVIQRLTTTIQNFDATFEFWLPDTTLEMYPEFKYRSTPTAMDNNFYAVSLPAQGGEFNVKLKKRVSNVNTTLGTTSAVTVASNTHYFMRVRVNGSVHKIKIWGTSFASEPTTGGVDGAGFQISVTDTAFTAAGYCGFGNDIGNASATRDLYLDNLTIGDPPSNIAPTANAGPDQTAVEPYSTVTLDGSGSTDSDGTIASYAWTQSSGTTVTLSSTSVASPTFTAPGKLGGDTLVFSLTVTDNLGASSTADTVSISVGAPTNYLAGSTVWQPYEIRTL